MKAKKPYTWPLVLLLVVLPAQAGAQSITLTAPTVPTVVPEGDDFAAVKLQNAWDFDQRRDIAWERNFAPGSINAGGVWRGLNSNGYDGGGPTEK